jgi:hypothetical protein
MRAVDLLIACFVLSRGAMAAVLVIPGLNRFPGSLVPLK